jgi:hypothetical protein
MDDRRLKADRPKDGLMPAAQCARRVLLLL